VATQVGEMMQIQTLGKLIVLLAKVTLLPVRDRKTRFGKQTQVEFQHGETMQILLILLKRVLL
jgi:hypothetical protein